MEDTKDKPLDAPSAPDGSETIGAEGVLRSGINLHAYIQRRRNLAETEPSSLLMNFTTFCNMAHFPFTAATRTFDTEKCTLLGIPVQLGEYEDGYIGAVHEVSPAPTKKETGTSKEGGK